MTISVYTFGGFTLRVNGRRVLSQAWGSRQTMTLGKVLLTYEQPVDKRQLQEWLWPDLPTSVTCRHLDRAVQRLRHVLMLDTTTDASYLDDSCRGTLHLDTDNLWVDSHALLTASRLDPAAADAVRQLEQAENLYRGPYLADDIDATWAHAERERLAAAYEVLVLKIADAYAIRGNLQAATLACQTALQFNPACSAATWRLKGYTHREDYAA
jgi:two-component SAPR family response regulator